MKTDNWQEFEQKTRNIPKEDLNIKSILALGTSIEITFDVAKAKLATIFGIFDLAEEITPNLSISATIDRMTTPDDDFTTIKLEITQVSDSSESSFSFIETESEIAEDWEGGTAARDFEMTTPCNSLDELKEQISKYLKYLISQGYEISLDT